MAQAAFVQKSEMHKNLRDKSNSTIDDEESDDSCAANRDEIRKLEKEILKSKKKLHRGRHRKQGLIPD